MHERDSKTPKVSTLFAIVVTVLAAAFIIMASSHAEAAESEIENQGATLTAGWNQCGTCEWQVDSAGTLTIRPLGNGAMGALDDWGTRFPPWHSQRDKIKKIDVAGKVKALTLGHAFGSVGDGYSNLVDISGLANFDVSAVENMEGVFAGCTSLSELSGIAGWDTSNVMRMDAAFAACGSLKVLNELSRWNTTNVTSMNTIFSNCSSLAQVDALRTWKVSNVTDMTCMFFDCNSLRNVNGLADWNVSNVEQVCTTLVEPWGMFHGCASLSDISGLAKWNTSKMECMWYMFRGCSNLSDITPLANWDTSNAFSIAGMFSGCPVTKLSFGKKWNISSESVDNSYYNWFLWTPTGDDYTGKWVSYDAAKRGPLSTKDLLFEWDYASMRGTWIAQTYSQQQPPSDPTDISKPNSTDNSTSLNRPEQTMHRLYNPNSGEHFYTMNTVEKDNLANIGWQYEGIAWNAPKTGAPVYRMYNPNAGDHHYTPSAAERDSLVTAGWNYEGIGWYSERSKKVPLYRLYNPNAIAGSHHYTTNANERDQLVSVGWQDEGIGWYGS